MSEDSRVREDEQFIQICVELNLLEKADAAALSQTIRERGPAVVQTVLQQGLLTPADVDIAQSLLHPTEVVPGYAILELVGRGGMGVVYRAEQLDLERIVALKTVLISEISDSTIPARFEREAKSLAKLHHPNIVQALNFGKHLGRYYFTMEYVSGRTCEQVIRDDGFMPAAQAWPIIRQVASGLMHALGHNVIHRDIKPSNLILVSPPEGYASAAEGVKIADFGLAILADHSPEQLKLTTGDKILGSPAYMSLEQFGGRQVDFRSDMYSLGATAWHLLFGSPPFRGTSVAALFRQKSEPFLVDPEALPFMLPDDQMHLLVGLLDPNPDRRPDNYPQLIDAIDALQVVRSPDHSPHASRVDASVVGGVSISDQPTMQPTSPSVLGAVETSEAEVYSGGMSRTVEIVRQPKPRIAKPLAIALSAVAVILMAVVIAMTMLTRTPRGVRSHLRVVANTPLFDGVTLAGWDVGGSMVGAWNTVEAPDASTAIACTTRRGALTRRLPLSGPARISLFVWLQPDSGPVDIDFALDPSNDSDVRGCLRLSDDVNQLGKKVTDFGELTVVNEWDALATVHDRYHVVHIERQPSDWFVFLEEQLMGTLPIRRVGDEAALRIVVHGSESPENPSGADAFFADVQLYELALPK